MKLILVSLIISFSTFANDLTMAVAYSASESLLKIESVLNCEEPLDFDQLVYDTVTISVDNETGLFVVATKLEGCDISKVVTEANFFADPIKTRIINARRI